MDLILLIVIHATIAGYKHMDSRAKDFTNELHALRILFGSYLLKMMLAMHTI